MDASLLVFDHCSSTKKLARDASRFRDNDTLLKGIFTKVLEQCQLYNRLTPAYNFILEVLKEEFELDSWQSIYDKLSAPAPTIWKIIDPFTEQVLDKVPKHTDESSAKMAMTEICKYLVRVNICYRNACPRPSKRDDPKDVTTLELGRKTLKWLAQDIDRCGVWKSGYQLKLNGCPRYCGESVTEGMFVEQQVEKIREMISPLDEVEVVSYRVTDQVFVPIIKVKFPDFTSAKYHELITLVNKQINPFVEDCCPICFGV